MRHPTGTILARARGTIRKQFFAEHIDSEECSTYVKSPRGVPSDPTSSVADFSCALTRRNLIPPITIGSRTMGWSVLATGTARSVTRLAPVLPFVVATLTCANYRFPLARFFVSD